MNESLQELETLRSRWRRARARLQMQSTDEEGFATGGLGRFVEDLSVRFLIQPRDPEAALLSFDDGFWSWFSTGAPNPFDGSQTDWGHEARPAYDAAVRHDHGRDGVPWSWTKHLAITRSGGLEFALGRAGGFSWKERRQFNLIEIVGRMWVAVSLYGELTTRFGVQGPWECSLALRETQGADLGNAGEGWLEPGNGFDRLPQCGEDNLLFRLEVELFADEPSREIAFSFGDRIEDAWSIKDRRYLARTGARSGLFDVARYRG